MQINITYDASVANAPPGFEAAVQAAVAYLDSVIATPITVNIQFSYGEVAGQPLEPDAIGENEALGSFFTYAQVRNALASAAVSPDAVTGAASLPASDPTNGGEFFVNTAQQKALGLLSADGTSIDGYVGLSSDVAYTFDPNDRAVSGLYDAVGILEHEITEVLGRVADVGEAQTNTTDIYSPLDLFRYATAGARDLTPAGDFFSINGKTLLSQFNNAAQNGGDPGDWASSVPGDSFDAFAQPGVELAVSATDLRELDVLGFQPSAPAPVGPIVTPTPTVAASAPIDLAVSGGVAQGQSYYFTDDLSSDLTTGFTIGVPGGVGPQFVNAGVITVIITSDHTASAYGIAGGRDGATVTNTSSGAIYVDGASPTDGPFLVNDAYGVNGAGANMTFDNAGLLQVVSSTNAATGASGLELLDNEATGVIRVWAATTGVGVDGGVLDNAGLIDVVAQNAVGEENASSFTNTGTIEATDINGGWGSIGAEVGVENSSLTNLGTIQADYAVYYDTTQSGGVSGNFSLNNSGRLIGDVVLANGQDQVTNTGSIVGNIYFGDGNSTYDGASGTLSGAIYLGWGTNAVTLGNGDGVVYGGFGADTITGGAGNDFFEIGAGNNTIDGGAGFNILSFQASATNVTVDLAAGTASDAGADTITNIQEVIGSNFNDTLIAGPGGSTLIAGSGFDTLIGGVGNDTLIAGAGGDTTTGGGGANTFIYSAGDQQLVITDFGVAGATDVLEIYGYSSAQSVIQQGANTLIQLGDGDSILLEGVQSASLNASEVVYSAAPYHGQSLPPSSQVFGSDTVFVYAPLEIYPGEVIYEQDQPYGFVATGFDITNYGSVAVSYPVAQLSDVVYGFVPGATESGGNPIGSNGSFINEPGSTFTVYDLDGGAMGFFAAGEITNAGNITITAGGQGWGTEAGANFVNTNTGVFSVSAGGDAIGIDTGGTTENDGVFQVLGGTSAVGVLDNGVAFINTGTFTVSTAPGANYAYGIAIEGLADFNGNSIVYTTITNSGTITAPVAIQLIDGDYSPTQYPYVDIVNSGAIHGEIDLIGRQLANPDYVDILDGDGGVIGAPQGTIAQEITNTGSIVGDIRLDDTGIDLFNGVGGRFSGVLYLGFAQSTVNLGGDGEVVVASPSGGNATITGGGGNDFIEIARGDNTIDGGGGFNTLSFAEADMGVTVNLGAGTASAAGSDTVKNIQEVIGSSFNDTLIAGATAVMFIAGSGHDVLTGGAGSDTLVAGAGDDTMTGGGGNNAFIYSTGDHQLVVTDFDANGDHDVLHIDGYTSAQSVQQQGANTLITLSATDSILLDGVQASSLSGGAVVYSANPYAEPVAPPTPAILGGSPALVYSNFTINPGEMLHFTATQTLPEGIDAAAFLSPYTADVINSGSVTVSADLAFATGIAGADFTNAAGATFALDNTGGSALGAEGNLTNSGVFQVTASGDAQAAVDTTNLAGGVIDVTAGGVATGVALVDQGGDALEAGTLDVVGGTTAYGMSLGGFGSSTVTVTGQLTASATSNSGVAYGLYEFSTGAYTLINSGTITAQDAVATPYSEQGQFVTLDNSGTINGDVDLLSLGRDSVIDTGTINGNIRVGDGTTTVDLRGGVLTGDVIIAPQADGDPVHDTIFTGANNATIQALGGAVGQAQATITGGGGQVSIEFDIASTSATWSEGVDNTWTVNAGVDGTLKLTGVQTLEFTDRTVVLGAPLVPNDFNADGKSDFLIQNTSGSVVVGEDVGGSASYGQVSGLGPEWSFRATGDYLGDGHADYLIQNTSGSVYVGEVAGGSASYTAVASLGPEWSFKETGDFLGHGDSQFLIQNAAGAIDVGEVVGGQATYTPVANLGSQWSFVGAGDFLGEGHDQFLIENTTGDVFVGDVVVGSAAYTGVVGLGTEWKFVGTGDFLGDGKADFMIQNTSGDVFVGEVTNGGAVFTGVVALGAEWKFVGTGDYLGEGHDQFLIENTAGQIDVGDFTGGAIHFTQVGALGPEWAFH